MHNALNAHSIPALLVFLRDVRLVHLIVRVSFMVSKGPLVLDDAGIISQAA